MGLKILACRVAVPALVVIAVASSASSAQAISISEFSNGISSNPSLEDATAGSDGNVWFGEGNTSAPKLAKITPSGVVTEYSTGLSSGAEPFGLTLGSDHRIWFSDHNTHQVGAIDPTTGTINEYGSTAQEPDDITLGPDNNLWFGEAGGMYGYVTTAGAIHEFGPSPLPSSYIDGITAGPDGNIWMVMDYGNEIVKVRPSDGSVLAQYTTGITASSGPDDIVAGADGNLWFTEYETGKIARITTSGVVTEFPTGVSPSASLDGITRGPDGNLWFTVLNSSEIGRITPTGAVTLFSNGIAAGSSPDEITRGADGNIWFEEDNTGHIGKLTITPDFVSQSAAGNGAGAERLSGVGNPQGLATLAVFQYGRTPSLELGATPAVSLGSGLTSASWNQTVPGLASSTTYYYRAVLHNSQGTVYGPTQTFTSPAGGGKPSASIGSAKVSSKHHSARFNFTATAASGFQCALVKKKKHKKPKPSFSSCTSPKTYKHLKKGKYTFEVRALGPGGSGAPASKSFKIA